MYHARLTFKSRSVGGDKIVAGEKVIPYPATAASTAAGLPSKSEIPVAISLTEFHYLLLYPSKLLAISKLSGEVVFEQGFKERFGEMRGMVTDPCSPGNTMPVVWLFSNRSDVRCLLMFRVPTRWFTPGQGSLPTEHRSRGSRCMETVPPAGSEEG